MARCPLRILIDFPTLRNILVPFVTQKNVCILNSCVDVKTKVIWLDPKD